MASILDVARALSAYEGLEGAEVERLPGGLINESFLIRFGPQRYVLQRVAAIFDPAIHHNIAAVTEHLAGCDILTPRLLPTREGALYVELEDIGCWRLMSHVAGVSYDKLPSPEHAEAAAELVGRVHAALDDLEHTFVGMRLGVHDTARHLSALERAVAELPDHRLAPHVGELARAIAASAEALPPLPELAPRTCHGDLKISNVLFDETGLSPRALCLIDLDTLGPMSLAFELGDAWRSWCNPAREDDLEAAAFDMAIFEASWRGYRLGVGEQPSEVIREALLGGPEWISLELAARFAADALREAYFGWDEARFASRGDHNLVRARGQWALHRATVSTRDHRASLLGLR